MRGGYQTLRKAWIERALCDAGAHAVTADELYEVLKRDGLSVGRTTVYRQLEELCRVGAARKVKTASGAGAYQFVGDARACAGHLHCQCDRCGRLTHIDCDWLEGLARHLLEAHGFVLDAADTVFKGRCAACKEEIHGATDA